MTSLNIVVGQKKTAKIWYLSFCLLFLIFFLMKFDPRAMQLKSRRKCHWECQIVSVFGPQDIKSPFFEIYSFIFFCVFFGFCLAFWESSREEPQRISFRRGEKNVMRLPVKIAQAANVFMWRPNFLQPPGTTATTPPFWPKCNLWREAHAKEPKNLKLIYQVLAAVVVVAQGSTTRTCVEGLVVGLLPSVRHQSPKPINLGNIIFFTLRTSRLNNN